MQDTIYTKEEKDFLYLLIYNYLKYGKYDKAVKIINGLSFHPSDAYLLRCLLYGYVMLKNYAAARLTSDLLGKIDSNLNQDGWFSLMQSIILKKDTSNNR